jgi:hypothetical protein
MVTGLKDGLRFATAPGLVPTPIELDLFGGERSAS